MFVPDRELNAELCVSSGQVFRFARTEDGWAGADGRNLVSVKRADGGWEVDETGSTLFQLHKSLADIEHDLLSRAQELSPRIRRFTGLRVLHQMHAHETLFSFLCTSNNNLARIVPMVKKLGDYGEPIGEGFHEFPSVARIAEISEAELRAKGFGYRARIIPRVARLLLDKTHGWLESLRSVPYREAHGELCELDGIGPKIADCVCLVGLWHDEAVPVDTHLWQAACELYFPEWKGSDITEKKYRAVGDLMRERFGKLAGWAHQYLFYERILDYRNGRMPVYL